MATYGYVRKDYPTSTTEQLKLVMTYPEVIVYVEESSFQEETEWLKLVKQLKEQDILVVADLQVFGKTIKRLVEVMDQLAEKGIRLISADNQLDTAHNQLFYDSFQLIAQTEKACQSDQVKQNIALSRKLGRIPGRPTIDQEVIDEIQRYYHNKFTLRSIAQKCNVSLGTVHKYTKMS